MSGTNKGGLKAKDTIKSLYGKDFYARIGAKGGRASNIGGFASDKVGADGLTGKQRARIVGSIGGRLSKKGSKVNK